MNVKLSLEGMDGSGVWRTQGPGIPEHELHDLNVDGPTVKASTGNSNERRPSCLGKAEQRELPRQPQ